MAEESNLQGLGGWLVLVGLGIVIAPLTIIGSILPDYSEMFSNGSWEVLTTPGTEAYDSLWAPLLYGEIAINGAFVLAWVFIGFLFFSKNRAFPKWYIGILLFTLAFVVLEPLAIKAVLPNDSLIDAAATKEIGRALITSLIWIPYMLVSKRVKATFVK